MKIDMLHALSSNRQNGVGVKSENIEEDFLSILSNKIIDDEVINAEIINVNSEIESQESLIKNNKDNENSEVDEKLMELIGVLLNKINPESNASKEVTKNNMESVSLKHDKEITVDINKIEEKINLYDFINNNLKNNVDNLQEKVEKLFINVNKLTSINNLYSENDNVNLENGLKDAIKFNKLLSSNEVKEKLIDLGLNEERIENIKEQIDIKKTNLTNENITLDNKLSMNSEDNLQVEVIVKEIIDVVKSMIPNENKVNRKELKEITLIQKLSNNDELIKKDDCVSTIENYIEANDELEIISNFKMVSIQDSSSKLIKTSKLKTRDILNDTSTNTSNNELNILNNIVLTKSNNTTELEFKIVQPQVIRSEYISEDIVQTIKYLKGNNTEEISVKMNPKDLGELNIKILKSNNEEKVVVTLSNDETFNLLKENINDIKSHLNSLDINVKEIAVEIKSNNQNDFSDNLNQQFNKNNHKEEKKSGHAITEQSNNENAQDDENLNINLLI